MKGSLSPVTASGYLSISDAQTGVMPLRTAAYGNPPLPSKRLAIVGVLHNTIPPAVSRMQRNAIAALAEINTNYVVWIVA